jgi:hypothetical protein
MTKPKGPETLWTLTAAAEHLHNLAKDLRSQAESLAYDAAEVEKQADRLHDRLDCYAREHDPDALGTVPATPRADTPCPQCGGSGIATGGDIIEHTCPTCGGSGIAPAGSPSPPTSEQALARGWQPGEDRSAQSEYYHILTKDGDIYDVAGNLGELAETAAQCHATLPVGTYEVTHAGKSWGFLILNTETWRVRGEGVDLAPGSIAI